MDSGATKRRLGDGDRVRTNSGTGFRELACELVARPKGTGSPSFTLKIRARTYRCTRERVVDTIF